MICGGRETNNALQLISFVCLDMEAGGSCKSGNNEGEDGQGINEKMPEEAHGGISCDLEYVRGQWPGGGSRIRGRRG